MYNMYGQIGTISICNEEKKNDNASRVCTLQTSAILILNDKVINNYCKLQHFVISNPNQLKNWLPRVNSNVSNYKLSE